MSDLQSPSINKALIRLRARARLYFTARSEHPSRRAISLTRRRTTVWDFSFPCAFYEGVELFLHRSSLARPPEFFAACGVDLNEIAAHLRAGRIRNWTRAAAPEESRLFRELIPGAGDFEHARLRLTIPLLLLRIAGSGAPRRESESAIYSRRQVDIAKRAEALLTDDISRRRSIAEVAAPSA